MSSHVLARAAEAVTPFAVHLRDLHKVYTVSEREAGMRAALRSLAYR